MPLKVGWKKSKSTKNGSIKVILLRHFIPRFSLADLANLKFCSPVPPILLKQSEIPGIHSAILIFFVPFLRMQSSSTQQTQKLKPWALLLYFWFLLKYNEKIVTMTVKPFLGASHLIMLLTRPRFSTISKKMIKTHLQIYLSKEQKKTFPKALQCLLSPNKFTNTCHACI